MLPAHEGLQSFLQFSFIILIFFLKFFLLKPLLIAGNWIPLRSFILRVLSLSGRGVPKVLNAGRPQGACKLTMPTSCHLPFFVSLRGEFPSQVQCHLQTGSQVSLGPPPACFSTSTTVYGDSYHDHDATMRYLSVMAPQVTQPPVPFIPPGPPVSPAATATPSQILSNPRNNSQPDFLYTYSSRMRYFLGAHAVSCEVPRMSWRCKRDSYADAFRQWGRERKWA